MKEMLLIHVYIRCYEMSECKYFLLRGVFFQKHVQCISLYLTFTSKLFVNIAKLKLQKIRFVSGIKIILVQYYNEF